MRVALFLTCVNDALHPRTGQAVVALLERLGVEVDFPPGQTCCGQPQYNTGYRHATEPLVRRMAEVFAGYDHVVSPSGSCAAMVRDNYPRIGARAAAEGRGPALADAAAGLVPRVYELTEFLVDVLGVTDVGAYYPHTVTYHPSCHGLRMLGPVPSCRLDEGARPGGFGSKAEEGGDGGGTSQQRSCLGEHRRPTTTRETESPGRASPAGNSEQALGLGERPLRLLRAVRGLRLVELPGAEECCGFGGTFAVKNPDVSAAMGADKIAGALSTGAEVLCGADNSCLMHLDGMLRRAGAPLRTVHLAEILASTEAEVLA